MLWRLGSGDIGGKAMGLEFFNSRINFDEWNARFAPHRLRVPDTAVLRTDLFAEFVEKRKLIDTFETEDDDSIRKRFLAEEITPRLAAVLESYLERKTFPLAVRSSARNEDAQNHPFAGLYITVLLPNSSPDRKTRLRQLEEAVKLVYASAFMKNPKHYMQSHGLSIENEKMAVVLQELVGRRRGDLFYPHLAGVAQSLNFFPVSYLKPKDGIALLVMGLGKAAVDGRFGMRFCPAYPLVRPQMQQAADMMRLRQKDLYALDMTRGEIGIKHESDTLAFIPVADVMDDEILPYIASTYSPSEGVVYPGIRKGGTTVLTFDRLMQSELFPLPEALKWLLEKNEAWWKVPVDLEFAVDFDFGGSGAEACFCLLQARPLVVHSSTEEVGIPGGIDPSRVIVRASQTMGNGVLDTLGHIIYVPLQALDPGRSRSLADQVGALSSRLLERGKRYMLVGPGRWGSTNLYLGIPAVYSHIEGAGAIVEVTWDELKVEPSQGTHFFSNIVSGRIMVLFVNLAGGEAVLNRAWLDAQPDAGGQKDVRLIELSEPLHVVVDGRNMKGMVYQ